MSDRISLIVSAVARLPGDHRLQRVRVVEHRTEGLTELVGDRRRERRHRLAAAGVSGERQVPPALDLGPLACAALVEEPDDQEELDGQHAGCAQHRALGMRSTGSGRDSARRCRAVTGSRGFPTAAIRANRISADRAPLRRDLDACGRGAVQESSGHVRCVATQLVHGHQPSADNAKAEHRARAMENRGAFAVA